MKKIALALVAVLLMTGVAMAQYNTKNQGYVMGYVVPTSTTPTTEYIKKNSFVMITADTTLYLCKINIGVGSRLSTTMLASASNYAIINRAVFGGKAITFFVDTANAQNIYGVKTFKNNASFAGTLGVTGNVAVNTNKFNVTAASGNTTVAGTLGVTGDVAVNTNKFTVTAASGNTAVAGTLGVTGKTTLTGVATTRSIMVNDTAAIYPANNDGGSIGASGRAFSTLYITTGYASAKFHAPIHQVVPGDTTGFTAALGMIVYKTSDNHFYGCKNTGAGKKWYQLEN